MGPEIFRGVDRLLSAYAGLERRDAVVVVYSPDSRDAAAWLAAGVKARGVEPSLVAMRPLVDEAFEERLRGVLPAKDDLAGRLVIFTLEKESMSHFGPLTSVLEEYGDDCQIVRIISASEEFFTEGLNLTPDELSQRNATLLSRLNGRKTIRIKSDGGTDLQVELDSSRYDWISNRGLHRGGHFTILPAGEIATYPAAIEGVLVADGAVNCNVISRLDMRLADTPLTVEVEGGRAVDFSCANPRIHELVGLCFTRPYGRNVGELGFGTNVGVRRFLPENSHLNERRPGVHVGFGQHNQPPSRVSYLEDIHLDLIADGARIEIDGEPGVLDLHDLAVTCAAHPDVRDEDITGDCCGFGYRQLRVAATGASRALVG
ncbi:MAG TPA: hypothetical protein VGB14_20640 [Acidimicrobiales bacterium]